MNGVARSIPCWDGRSITWGFIRSLIWVGAGEIVLEGCVMRSAKVEELKVKKERCEDCWTLFGASSIILVYSSSSHGTLGRGFEDSPLWKPERGGHLEDTYYRPNRGGSCPTL
jgi:hypothetical protein